MRGCVATGIYCRIWATGWTLQLVTGCWGIGIGCWRHVDDVLIWGWIGSHWCFHWFWHLRWAVTSTDFGYGTALSHLEVSLRSSHWSIGHEAVSFWDFVGWSGRRGRTGSYFVVWMHLKHYLNRLKLYSLLNSIMLPKFRDFGSNLYHGCHCWKINFSHLMSCICFSQMSRVSSTVGCLWSSIVVLSCQLHTSSCMISPLLSALFSTYWSSQWIESTMSLSFQIVCRVCWHSYLFPSPPDWAYLYYTALSPYL